MSSERLQQIQDIVVAALEREPIQRSVYITDACRGDALLREEVEFLIAAQRCEGSSLDSPVEPATQILTSTRSLTVGQKLSHYEILGRLGQGGMGEVYVALDTKLRRNVALKVLPSLNRGSDAQRRLVREARAAATLDHTNICCIYEVGEDKEQSYIAMQYVEGETLAARMARQRLSVNEVLILAGQIASALAEAHAHRIIHRDVKPANIMVTNSGQIKVLDFGLSKCVGEDVTTQSTTLLTSPGMILGTAPYMSPEQLQGEQLDERSDVFSFGVVLYEMLSGVQPFSKPSVPATIGAILHAEPPDLLTVAPVTPPALRDLVTRCLAKNRSERYPSMKPVTEVLNNLGNEQVSSQRIATTQTERPGVPQAAFRETRIPTTLVVILMILIGVGLSVVAYQWFSSKPTSVINSVAVLPLNNSSADPNLEYLSDGLTENLINNLAQLSQLKVMSRNSVFHYKGKEIDAQKVGKELGVRAVLKGDMQIVGDQVMINVELIDTSDNRNIWGGSYKRKVADIMATQNDISREVVSHLRVKLNEPEERQLAKRPTENPAAYKFYLQGSSEANRESPESLHRAIGFYKQAIANDSNFSLAYLGLGHAYLLLGIYFESPKETMPEAKINCLKALTLDNSLVDAHLTLGVIYLIYDWDWDGAERELTSNGELNPKVMETFTCTAHILESRGRTTEAEEKIKAALVTDPLSIPLNTELGCNSYYARKFEAAVTQNNETLELASSNPLAYWGLARAFGQLKMYSEALDALKKIDSFEKSPIPIIVAERGYIYAAWGKKTEALATIQELDRMAKQVFVDPYLLASVYAGLGDKDKALEFLEKSYQAKSSFITSMNSEPKFDFLRSDARFKDLLRRVGFSAQQVVHT